MLKNKKQKSVMKHDFSQVPHANIQRSNFNRSHGYKTTFDSGYLIPIYVDEALPGDSLNLSLSSVARLAIPLVPFMDNLHLDFHFFAVPNRLIWDNWQKFMGEQADPDSSIDFVVPQIDDQYLTGSLSDYFGLPIITENLSVNSLHHRAYNLIWNEWFRSQDLQDSVTVDTDDGPDDLADYVLLKRGKRHDYFTSCLPSPQKGTGVELPLGTSAPIVTDTDVSEADDLTVYSNDLSGFQKLSTGAAQLIMSSTSGLEVDSLYTDLSSATAATINSLREAFQLQRLLERDARGGTRYTEILRSHFKVDSPDSRLQRPEYLGGGTSPLNVTPIANTSDTATFKQGHLSAVGYHQQSGVGFTKSFVEHCVIIGMVSVRADLTYQKGLDRMFSRTTKYDYYWPALAHLGEQAVLNKEIWADGSANDELVFGYQERWAEYRYFPSKITGVLRSDAAASLDAWHLSQDFDTLPALNAAFIQENPPVDRVVAVTSEPEFIFDGYFKLTCTRPMPTYSVPGLIDHF